MMDTDDDIANGDVMVCGDRMKKCWPFSSSQQQQQQTRQHHAPPHQYAPPEPLFEEDIIDGFAVASFATYSDLQWAVRLAEKRGYTTLQPLLHAKETYSRLCRKKITTLEHALADGSSSGEGYLCDDTATDTGKTSDAESGIFTSSSKRDSPVPAGPDVGLVAGAADTACVTGPLLTGAPEANRAPFTSAPDAPRVPGAPLTSAPNSAAVKCASPPLGAVKHTRGTSPPVTASWGSRHVTVPPFTSAPNRIQAKVASFTSTADASFSKGPLFTGAPVVTCVTLPSPIGPAGRTSDVTKSPFTGASVDASIFKGPPVASAAVQTHSAADSVFKSIPGSGAGPGPPCTSAPINNCRPDHLLTRTAVTVTAPGPLFTSATVQIPGVTGVAFTSAPVQISGAPVPLLTAASGPFRGDPGPVFTSAPVQISGVSVPPLTAAQVHLRGEPGPVFTSAPVQLGQATSTVSSSGQLYSSSSRQEGRVRTEAARRGYRPHPGLSLSPSPPPPPPPPLLLLGQPAAPASSSAGRPPAPPSQSRLKFSIDTLVSPGTAPAVRAGSGSPAAAPGVHGPPATPGHLGQHGPSPLPAVLPPAAAITGRPSKPTSVSPVVGSSAGRPSPVSLHGQQPQTQFSAVHCSPRVSSPVRSLPAGSVLQLAPPASQRPVPAGSLLSGPVRPGHQLRLNTSVSSSGYPPAPPAEHRLVAAAAGNSKTAADLLRRELDTRLLASLDRGLAARPAGYLPPSAAALAPLAKSLPSFGGVDSPFYPGAGGSLLSPLPTGLQRAPGSTAGPFLPLAAPHQPQPKKTGRWNAMHVRIAWEIYKNQRRRRQQQPGCSSDAGRSAPPLSPLFTSSRPSPALDPRLQLSAPHHLVRPSLQPQLAAAAGVPVLPQSPMLRGPGPMLPTDPAAVAAAAARQQQQFLGPTRSAAAGLTPTPYPPLPGPALYPGLSLPLGVPSAAAALEHPANQYLPQQQLPPPTLAPHPALEHQASRYLPQQQLPPPTPDPASWARLYRAPLSAAAAGAASGPWSHLRPRSPPSEPPLPAELLRDRERRRQPAVALPPRRDHSRSPVRGEPELPTHPAPLRSLGPPPDLLYPGPGPDPSLLARLYQQQQQRANGHPPFYPDPLVIKPPHPGLLYPPPGR